MIDARVMCLERALGLAKAQDAMVCGAAARQLLLRDVGGLKEDAMVMAPCMSMLLNALSVFWPLDVAAQPSHPCLTAEASDCAYRVALSFCPGLPPVHLLVVSMQLPDFLQAFCPKLDCDLFILGRSTLMLAPTSMLGDPLQALMDRAAARRFSCVCTPQSPPEELVWAFDQAAQLVREHWEMTPSPLGSLYVAAKRERKCAICLNRVEAGDVVYASTCQHTFHWRCPSSEGLRAWWGGYHNTCPVCRAAMWGA